MRSEKLQTALLVVALLFVGALSWSFQLRPPLAVDASALRTFPEDVGDWRGEDVPLRPEEEAMLRADLNLQRQYRRALAQPIWLYVGYYGTDRGGHPEHTPDICYPANGWRTLQEATITIDPPRGLRANEFVAEQAGVQELVLYWYRSRHRTGITNSLGQAADRIAGRLLDGRADGALVRISTRFTDGHEVAAREQLLRFASMLDPLLEARWPVEQARGESAPKWAVAP